MSVVIQAQRRNLNSKSNDLRKKGQIPGCIFSKDRKTIPICLPYQIFRKFLSNRPSKFDIELEKGEKFLVGLREIQQDPINNSLLHISLQVLDQHRKVSLTIPVDVHEETLGKKKEGEIAIPIREITVKGYLSEIPEKMTIDVTHLDVGQCIKISDIESNYRFEFLQEDRSKIIVGRYHIQIQKTSLEETESPSQKQESETIKKDVEKTP